MRKCFTINPMRTKEEFKSFMTLLEDNTYQAIEIFNPFRQSLEQQKDYTDSVKEIKEKYPNTEIVLHLPHSKIDGLCLDEHLNIGSLQVMKDSADYAAQFGVKKLTLHLGLIDLSIDRHVYVDKVIPILQELCDFVSKNNQNIMIENMPGKHELGYSPDELYEIITRVDRKNLKFIFDTGHAHCSEYNDTDFLYKLKDYLFHIHYNDNDSTRDAHTRIGSGTIDFDKHFKALKDINYNQLHCMEVIYKDVNDLRTYAEDLKKYEDIL